MNQKGIVHLQLLLIALATILVIGFVGVRVFHSSHSKLGNSSNAVTSFNKTTDKKMGTANKSSENPAGTTSPSSGHSVSSSSTLKSNASTSNKTSSNSSSSNTGSNVSTNNPSTTPPLSLTIDTPTEGQVFTDGSGSIGIACTTNAPSGYDNVFTELLDSNNQNKGDFTINGARSDCSGSFGIYMPNGNYTLKMTVHDGSGGTATDSRHISVQVPNNPYG